MTTSMKSFRRAWTAGWIGAVALAVPTAACTGRGRLLIPIWVAIGPTAVRRLPVSRTESAEFHHQT